ncbi:hypothetical protein ACUN0C_15870 [Faunimonas sp. B44]|uniref:hypothetical protein n=1 Tax=Faunimonas sp. B44 TaxID=3461493 RepID=UPI004043CDC8
MNVKPMAIATIMLVGAALSGGAAADGALDKLPKVESLPAGVIQISPFIPGMGEHWADPKTLPLGPIYCVMDGRVTCMEFMIAQKDFEEGRSFEQLRPWFSGTEQPPIDHMEFNFEPHGHEGFTVPHYDIHMYFVSPEVRATTKAAMK